MTQKNAERLQLGRAAKIDSHPMHSLGARIEVISEEMAVVLRRKTGAQRLEIASRMFGSARRMLLSHLRSVHPDWDQREIEREAARRLSHGTV